MNEGEPYAWHCQWRKVDRDRPYAHLDNPPPWEDDLVVVTRKAADSYLKATPANGQRRVVPLYPSSEEAETVSGRRWELPTRDAEQAFRL